MTADEVKAKLRGRHAATQAMGVRTVPGPWTCVEELLGCDLLAIAAVQRPANGHPGGGAKYPRVGYEVKVSRADYRKELRNPHKRAQAVANTHAFYFAVPAGLLRPDEITARGPAGYDDAAGFLWVPEDVGLVVVDGRGCRVAHPSPVRREPTPIDGPLFGICARFISAHPDPRHDGVVDRDRALCSELRADERRRAAENAEMWRRWNLEQGRCPDGDAPIEQAS